MKPTRANRTGRYAFTAEEKAKIDAAYQAASGLARRRLEVLRLYAQGETYAYIIKTTAYSETTILKILRRYDEDGLDPIYDEPYTGKRKYPATRFEFTAAEIAELKEGCKKAAKPHVARRFKALPLRSEGKTLAEVATATGFTETNIIYLVKKYREGGTAALVGKSRPPIAFRYKFTQAQKAEIAEARKTVTLKRIAKRLDALLLRTEGKTVEQIASEVGLHPMTVMTLIRKYQEQGIGSIIANRKTGKNSQKLSERK